MLKLQPLAQPVLSKIGNKPKHESLVRLREKMPTIYRHRLEERFPPWRQPGGHKEPISFISKDPLLPHSQTEGQKGSLLTDSRQNIPMTEIFKRENPQDSRYLLEQYKFDRRYQRRNIPRAEQMQYDIMNNRKRDFEGRSEGSYYRRMEASIHTEHSAQANDASQGTSLRSTLAWLQTRQREITGKVGSCEKRHFSIPKPLLKIGSKNNYVDTYSPF